MSRAFVRESDGDGSSELPDRIVSEHPNLVTVAGLRQIEAHVRELEAARRAARQSVDSAERARVARELRYWQLRKASARVVDVAAQPDNVRFGVRVVLAADDASERAFRLVGEDEANPGRGLISWVSPLAKSLLGLATGDTVRFDDTDVEIVRIER